MRFTLAVYNPSRIEFHARERRADGGRPGIARVLPGVPPPVGGDLGALCATRALALPYNKLF